MSHHHIVGIADLSSGQVQRILDRAAELEGLDRLDHSPWSGRTLGMVFFDTSLRTRVGFASAATRLGGTFIDVLGPRANAVSSAESLADTLRVVAGYTDAIVVRHTSRLPDVADLPVPLINAGDVGPKAEHPSQALIDLYALRTLHRRPLAELRVGICGDPSMRAVRSLLAAFVHEAPREVRIIGADEYGMNVTSPQLPVTRGTLQDVRDLDVLYVAGMPHESLPLDVRDGLIVTETVVAELPDHAVVLSPMPVIDEIAPEARLDARVRIFEQSDMGLFVRMAMLEHLIT